MDPGVFATNLAIAGVPYMPLIMIAVVSALRRG